MVNPALAEATGVGNLVTAIIGLSLIIMVLIVFVTNLILVLIRDTTLTYNATFKGTSPITKGHSRLKEGKPER
jgi:hypothetical protein